MFADIIQPLGAFGLGAFIGWLVVHYGRTWQRIDVPRALHILAFALTPGLMVFAATGIRDHVLHYAAAFSAFSLAHLMLLALLKGSHRNP